ncbi:MAG: GatB/YqeY domain-containing protein, partial [Patescibacteria group bacterium]
MVNLKEKIKIEFREAFKAKEEVRLSVLKMLNAEIANAEISKRTKLVRGGETADLAARSELSDDEILEVIGREIKKRKESAEMYKKGNREDLEAKEKQEAEILLAYMPPQMTEEEIKNLAK